MKMGPFNVKGKNQFSYDNGDFKMKFYRKKRSIFSIDGLVDKIEDLLDLDELDELEKSLIQRIRKIFRA